MFCCFSWAYIWERRVLIAFWMLMRNTSTLTIFSIFTVITCHVLTWSRGHQLYLASEVPRHFVSCWRFCSLLYHLQHHSTICNTEPADMLSPTVINHSEKQLSDWSQEVKLRVDKEICGKTDSNWKESILFSLGCLTEILSQIVSPQHILNLSFFKVCLSC